MTDPTLTCPNCRTEIKLTESLAAPLIADARRRYETQLAQKEAEVAAREAAIRDQQQRLASARQAIDADVATRLDQERGRIGIVPVPARRLPGMAPVPGMVPAVPERVSLPGDRNNVAARVRADRVPPGAHRPERSHQRPFSPALGLLVGPGRRPAEAPPDRAAPSYGVVRNHAAFVKRAAHRSDLPAKTRYHLPACNDRPMAKAMTKLPLRQERRSISRICGTRLSQLPDSTLCYLERHTRQILLEHIE
jgi:hypothetical protein